MVFLPENTSESDRNMPLRQQLSDALRHIQGHLFPWLRNEVGPLTAEHERFVTVLGFVCVEAHVPMRDGGQGRPLEDRHAINVLVAH